MQSRKTNIAALIVVMASASTAMANTGMVALSDQDLGNQTGQALLNLSNVAPGQAGNPNTDVGFYRLGMEAKLELNANIRKLQLGCGGANGAGACDVDIDRLRFSGFTGTQNIRDDKGPLTDFVLNNPFIEFAIKNPTSASTREIVGLRLGAAQAQGVMSFGERPYNADGTSDEDTNVANHSGINRLTADMNLTVTAGKSPISIFGIPSGSATIEANKPATGDNIFLNQYFSRASSFEIAPLKAEYIGLDISIRLLQDFRMIHSIAVGSATTPANDFYISLSNLGNNLVEDKNTDEFIANFKPVNDASWIKWQKTNGTWSPSARGWSFSLPDVSVSNFTTPRISAFGGGGITTKTLTNLDLNQVPVDNCYGGLTFC